MGSWQPATEVFKKMDVDRFTIPVTVEWVDNIKKMKGYIDATEAGTKEVRLMITARVSGDYVNEKDGTEVGDLFTPHTMVSFMR